jgi:hypothetical protein
MSAHKFRIGQIVTYSPMQPNMRSQGHEWPDLRHYFSEAGRYRGHTEENWRLSMAAAVAFALTKIGAQS